MRSRNIKLFYSGRSARMAYKFRLKLFGCTSSTVFWRFANLELRHGLHDVAEGRFPSSFETCEDSKPLTP